MKNLFIPALVILYLLTACQRKVSAQVTASKIDTCINILKGYSHYWKKDSIGGNGFRELLGDRVLMNCDCKGRQWKDVVEYLGKPNFIYPKKDETEYRYRLNHYSDDIKHPGTLLLDIIVNKKGVITFFVVWEVDG